MTADELLFAIAPDARSVTAAREVLQGDKLRDLARSDDGRWLTARCHGSDWVPYTLVVNRTAEGVRCACDCGSPKYPCKHALALLALHHDHPERFAVGPVPDAQKKRVDRQAAIDLPRPAEAPKDAGEALLQAIYADPS